MENLAYGKKMQPKCAIFRQKSQKFSREGAQPPPQTLPPLGGKYPWPDRLLSVYICAPTFWFFYGIACIKVVMEKH